MAVAVVLLLGMVAVIGVCAAVLVKTNTSKSGRDVQPRAVSRPSDQDSEVRPKELLMSLQNI